MKTIALWAGNNYYPQAALGDFRGWFESVDAAKAALQDNDDWAEIWDLNLAAGRDGRDAAPEWERLSYWGPDWSKYSPHDHDLESIWHDS